MQITYLLSWQDKLRWVGPLYLFCYNFRTYWLFFNSIKQWKLHQSFYDCNLHMLDIFSKMFHGILPKCNKFLWNNMYQSYIKLLGSELRGGLFLKNFRRDALIFEFYCIFMWQFQKISKFQFFSEERHQSPGGSVPPSPPQVNVWFFVVFVWRNSKHTVLKTCRV